MPQALKEKEKVSPDKYMLHPKKALVTRASQRTKVDIPDNPIHYEEITPPGRKSMAMYSVLARPGQSTGTNFLHHGGDETLLVISGNFEIDLHDHKENLRPGDSIFIPRGALHRVTNIGTENAEAIFVLSPPEYTEGEH
ncbi:MAG: cupin domain-containing protein [Bacteriovorax sp.]